MVSVCTLMVPILHWTVCHFVLLLDMFLASVQVSLYPLLRYCCIIISNSSSSLIGSLRCLECCVNTTGDESCQPLLDNNGQVTPFPNGVFCDKGICTDVCVYVHILIHVILYVQYVQHRLIMCTHTCTIG